MQKFNMTTAKHLLMNKAKEGVGKAAASSGSHSEPGLAGLWPPKGHHPSSDGLQSSSLAEKD